MQPLFQPSRLPRRLVTMAAIFQPRPNAAIPPAGSGHENHGSTTPAGVRLPLGRPTQCEPFRELILAKLDQRLSAQRIWQDLVAEHGFTGSYDSVKRFVRAWAQRRRCPSAGWNVVPARRPKSISAPARR